MPAKHGTKITLVSFYNEEVGNAVLPKRLQEYQASQADSSRQSFYRRHQFTILAAMLVVLGLGGYAFLGRHLPWSKSPVRNGAAIPEKSIAVLPFDNFSDDKENTYFADGVQDDILTALAKVADLKVISRTSVMQYAVGTRRNLRDIAKALGVAHVLEGSVRRSGNHVRVSAQLIDARTDAHLWAEQDDRELADIFAIESEVAERIAVQLQARLSPREKAAIQEKPTANVAAFDLYIRAKTSMAKAVSMRPGRNLVDAEGLLKEALGLDPNFFIAYCTLASVHDQIYQAGLDHTPTRLLRPRGNRRGSSFTT